VAALAETLMSKNPMMAKIEVSGAASKHQHSPSPARP